MSKSARTGYMDLTDYSYELGEAKDGSIVYASKKDLLRCQPCAEECGIVKVSVTLKKVIQESDFKREEKQKEPYETSERRITHLKERIKLHQSRLQWYENQLEDVKELRDANKRPD